MALPQILAIGGLALAGVGIIGDYLQTRAEGQYANTLAQFNARLMQRNAQISMRQASMMEMLGAAQAASFAAQAAAVRQIGEFNARNVRAIAAFQAEASRRETQRLLGRQRAIYGASGVDTNSGSPLAVAEETAELGELDALMLLRNGEATAISILMDSAMQANSLMASGAIANMEAAAGAYAFRADATNTRWQAQNVLAQGKYTQQLANYQATFNAIGGGAQAIAGAYAGAKVGGLLSKGPTTSSGGGGGFGRTGGFGSSISAQARRGV